LNYKHEIQVLCNFSKDFPLTPGHIEKHENKKFRLKSNNQLVRFISGSHSSVAEGL
jgi:hypothetical protein